VGSRAGLDADVTAVGAGSVAAAGVEAAGATAAGAAGADGDVAGVGFTSTRTGALGVLVCAATRDEFGGAATLASSSADARAGATAAGGGVEGTGALASS